MRRPRTRLETLRVPLGIALAVALCCGLPDVLAQTVPVEGIREKPPTLHALVGARLYPDADSAPIDDAVVIIRDGQIEAVGARRDLALPKGAVVHDLTGAILTPGFTELGLEVEVTGKSGTDVEDRVGRSWNDKVRPERTPVEAVPLAKKTIDAMHALGFTSAVISPKEGVFAGSGAFVELTDEDPRGSIVRHPVASFGSFEHGGWGSREYPNSRMGAIALARQTLFDARWYVDAWKSYRNNPNRYPLPDYNDALAALTPVLDKKLPLALKASDPLEVFAGLQLAREHRINTWFLASGEEYQWLDTLREAKPRLVLPLDFPPAPAVTRPDESARVSLRRLETWTRAPENPARVAAAGLEFALTTRGLDDQTDFPARIRRALEHGLSFEDALDALTRVPARFIGEDRQFGRVAAGYRAHLAVFDGEPFAKNTRVLEVWVGGVRHVVDQHHTPDIRGEWQFAFGERSTMNVEIFGERRAPEGKVRGDGDGRTKVDLALAGPELSCTVDARWVGGSGWIGIGGSVSASGDEMSGAARFADGSRVAFRGIRTHAHNAQNGESDVDLSAKAAVAARSQETLSVPLGARGWTEAAHAPRRVVIRDATIWTCGPEGILENADLYVVDGKVDSVGVDLSLPPSVEEINAKGRHVTPGIVDAHSHTAIIGGVNEGTQAVTSEVRIEDVLDPNDINIYRQLAGGTTAALVLHGSANPIGGQAAIVKWRWGSSAEGLKVQKTPGMIKFALGENVKQANWGDDYTTRYPQTRMGVEQILRDRFHAAKEYFDQQEKAKEGDAIAPRRDLELDALVEILRGQRWIHCHSYRQDEILMLVRLAEEFGFRIGTFQHVLEGYKVAPELARHGAAGSTFSDWWAYKFEVYDGIPHNAALMHNAGVLTSINSDSDELARRLNLEAAKAVKYGGVSPEVAFKFVTINAARQLHIDDRVGSLEPGKDADFVLWSGDPLSTYTMCEETWVEGKRLFSRKYDMELRKRDRARKEELVQRVLADALGGDDGGAESTEKEDPDHGPKGCVCRGDHE